MVIIPAKTIDGRSAVFIGINNEDLKTMQERESRFAVIDFKEFPLPNGNPSKVIFIFGETDESIKKQVQSNHEHAAPIVIPKTGTPS